MLKTILAFLAVMFIAYGVIFWVCMRHEVSFVTARVVCGFGSLAIGLLVIRVLR